MKKIRDFLDEMTEVNESPRSSSHSAKKRRGNDY